MYSVIKPNKGKSMKIIDDKRKVFVHVYPGFLLSVISILGENYLKGYEDTEDEVLGELNIILKKMGKQSFLVNRFKNIQQEVLKKYGLDNIIISINSSSMRKPEVLDAMAVSPRKFNLSPFGEVQMAFDDSEKGARVSIYVKSLASSDLSKISDEEGNISYCGILTKLDDFWDKVIKNITDFIKSDDGKKSGFVEKGNKNFRKYERSSKASIERMIEYLDASHLSEIEKLNKKLEEKIEELDDMKKR